MTKPQLKLVIGDKNLSSWSLRAWLAAKQSQLLFEEMGLLLDRTDTRANLRKHSPSERVPCLIHNDLKVWDSLAICEYLHELAPQAKLWPTDATARALARSYCAEMHSGFASIRSQLSMDIRLRMIIRHLTSDTVSEIRRIADLWEQALVRFGGPFLFGDFTIADAFYAPVVFRFQSYGIDFNSSRVNAYRQAVLGNVWVKDWTDAALKEEGFTNNF